MIPARRWVPIALLVGLVGGAAVVRVQQQVDASLGPLQQEVDELYLPSPEWVKRLSLGYDGLLACVYWTRAVQHYGRHRLEAWEGGRPSYALLYSLLDITTTLDPELLLAYRFGAIFLTEPPPGGPGRPDLAVKLLEKGIAANPDYWRFWYDLGFVYYRAGDYQKSSEAFHTGAERPGALPWMRVMAAKVLAEGGDREKSRALWWEVYHSTDDKAIQTSALNHLAGLKVDEDVEQLQKLLKRYEEQTGQPARTWQELIQAGLLRGVPLDPEGYPYRLMPDGSIRLRPKSRIVSTLARSD
ncbi:MAG TPA: tetratricopeptide repeat protein [Candidatus Xenobia bacterium]|nr:tetratricopeptide repeat protein [Candidatus Xenobia bacterium]